MGDKEHVIAIVRDVSVRKQAEEALRESEQRFRSFIENANDIVYALDLEGRFTYVSPNWPEFMGEPADDAIKNSFKPYVHPNDVYLCQQFFEKVLTSGLKQSSVEYRIKKTDGSFRWHVSNGSPLRSREGDIIGYLGISRDVTEYKRMEQALRKSEVVYRSLAEYFPNGALFLFDENFRYLAAAGESLKKEGFSSEQIVNQKVKDVFPELWETIRPHCEVALSGKRSYYEVEYRGRLYSNVVLPIIADHEPIKRAIVVTTDVTEQKKAEEALRESEARLAQIVMGSPVPTFVIDKNHITTHWNKALENVTGVPGSDVIGTNRQWIAFYPQERAVLADLIVDNAGEDDISDYYEEVLQKSTMIEDAYAAEAFFPNMGERGRWLHFTAAPLRNVLGKVTGAVETLEDITERKRFEQRLRESEERYRNLFQIANDGIFILKDGRFFDCNPKTLEMFNCTHDQLIGKEPHECSPEFQPDGKASVEKATTSIKRTDDGELQFFQWKHCRFDGSLFDAEISLTRFELGGDSYILGIIRDITNRIEAEEQLKAMEKQLYQSQKMEAIGALAGGIAHDFNNILAAVIGYIELLQMSLSPNSKEWDYTRHILRAGNRAKDLVKQILTFSRQTETELKPVEVGIIAEEVAKLLRSSLPTTIEIECSIQGNTLVKGDPTQIHQILMNLCTNAGHAMQENGGLLTVDVRNIELEKELVNNRVALAPGIYAQLSVSDTGQGMSPEIVDRVFDPFFTTKERGEGTGMGLSVVHGIVESYRGASYVYSEEGKGSTFRIFLPAIERPTEPDKREDVKIPMGTERILLVDDESILVEMTTSQLEALGYRVTSRSNSIEALELFKKRPDCFDLLLTDMTMPQMTGDDLANEIRRIRPDIPVILCTGFSSKVTSENARLLNIDAFLMKPIIVRDMANTIRKVLD
jgi:PAS domain S-box-containing protein